MVNETIDNKQIELAELLSNYNEILRFVKTKIPEDELDIYLEFFKKSIKKEEPLADLSSEPGKIITMWGDEIQ